MPLPFVWLFAFYVPMSCAFEVFAPAASESSRRDEDEDDPVHAYGHDLIASQRR